MKTTNMKLKFLFLALSTLLFNCQQDTKKGATIDYAYADQPTLLACADMDTLLLNEALYAFQNDITAHYTPEVVNLPLSYRNVTSDALNGRAEYRLMVSEHTKEVFAALKQTPGIWRVKGDSYEFDYNGPLFACLAENFKDEDFKKTVNALMSTNSMSTRMIGDVLRTKTFQMKDDPYLASLVAFDLYYGKLFDVDLETPVTETESPAADANSHEGHNH